MAHKVLLIGSEGYAGQRLQKFLGDQRSVVLSTIDLRGIRSTTHLVMDVAELTDEDVRDYDSILFFAGASNVPESLDKPSWAIEENVLKLRSFASKMKQSQVLIYASSGSIYDGSLDAPESAYVKPRNIYDKSKLAGEICVSTVAPKTIGLRMGTLSGSSPNMRWDLVLNAMAKTSLELGKVMLANPMAHRTLLYLRDLEVIIKQLVLEEVEMPAQHHSILNLGSISLSMRSLAEQISEHYNSEIDVTSGSPTYDFSMDLTKMRSHFDLPESKISRVLEEVEDVFG